MRLRWLYWSTQVSAGIIFKILAFISYLTLGFLFFRLKVEGKEYIRGLEERLIIAPNHKSYGDHFFILAALPVNSKLIPARAMAADWLFKIPWYKIGFLIRWGLRVFGAYPVRKGQGLSITLRQPLEALEQGYNVGIYPEGGINFRKGIKKKEKKIGAAFLAQKTGTPILPVAIRGIDYLSWLEFFLGRRTVTVAFGKPFHAEPLKSAEEISGEIIKRIEELYEREGVN